MVAYLAVLKENQGQNEPETKKQFNNNWSNVNLINILTMKETITSYKYINYERDYYPTKDTLKMDGSLNCQNI